MNDTLPAAQETSQRRWLEVALVFVVLFVAGGTPVPHVNETHYLAKAKQYWQPDWCQGDLFLESGKAHLTFYWTVGILTQWFSLTTVAWLGRIAAWLALAMAWCRLSWQITGLRFASVVSAMLVVTLIDWTNFAGEWFVGGVEGKCFAYALVLLALANLVEQRWLRVWPLLGLASAFHVLVGGWSTIAVGLVWICQPSRERPALLAMSPALLLGGAFALAGVLPALNLTEQVSDKVVAEANQIYVFDRLPHHLAPLKLAAPELRRKVLRFSLLLVGFAWLRYCCRRMASQETPFNKLDLLMQFAVAALAISVAGLAWELATWNYPEVAARALKYYIFRLADIALPVATGLGTVWLISSLIQLRSRWANILLLLAIALPCWHLFQLSIDRYQNPCPPADRKLKDPLAWREACAWAREHTPADALFLGPRHGQSFKWYAGRSDLVTWKDVPQSAADLLTWRDRFFDVHRYRDEQGEMKTYSSLAKQGSERIKYLADKYDLDYILTEEYPPLDLPIVYQNDVYTIYSPAERTKRQP